MQSTVSDIVITRWPIPKYCNPSLALAVGDPHAKVPYQHLQPSNVIGLPPDIKQLCHPSTLRQEQLKALFKNIASVKFVGKIAKLNQSVCLFVCFSLQSWSLLIVAET